MFFIDSIICQMHEHVLDIMVTWFLIWFCRKSGQTIFVYVHSQWIHTHEDHINTKIIFESVNQMGLVDVFLNDLTVLMWLYFVHVSSEVDSTALCLIFWLHNERSWILLLPLICQKVFIITRKQVCCRKKVILIWQQVLHPHAVSPKHVLLREVIYARKVIHSLMRLHLLQKFYAVWPIKPCVVPIFLCLFTHVEFS